MICRCNFPETHVYNQCANTMLQHCLKQHGNHTTDPLKHLYHPEIGFPDPIKPGDVDLIMAGYPW
jgi:DNA (cytosine-5)-methyltransferase 1